MVLLEPLLSSDDIGPIDQVEHSSDEVVHSSDQVVDLFKALGSSNVNSTLQVPSVLPAAVPSTGTDQDASSCGSSSNDEMSGGKRKRKREEGKQCPRKNALSLTDVQKSEETMKWFSRMQQQQDPLNKPHILIRDGKIENGHLDVLYLWGTLGVKTLPLKKMSADKAYYAEEEVFELQGQDIETSVQQFTDCVNAIAECCNNWEVAEETESEEAKIVLDERFFLVERIDTNAKKEDPTERPWRVDLLSCRNVLLQLLAEEWKIFEGDFYKQFCCLEWPHITLLLDVPTAFDVLEKDVLNPFPCYQKTCHADNASKFKLVFNNFIDGDGKKMMMDFVSKQVKKASKDFRSSCLRRRLRFLYRCIWYIVEIESVDYIKAAQFLRTWFFIKQENQKKPFCEYEFGMTGNRNDVPQHIFDKFVESTIFRAAN